MALVGYVDLTDFAKDLTEIQGGSLEKNTKLLVASSLAQIELLADAYAPRRSGKLVGSISTETFNNGMSGRVKATASYAGYLEFGTGTRGEFPGNIIVIRPRNGKYLKFKGKNGQMVYAKEVRSPGMAPRPFLRPAFERVISPLVSGIADAAMFSVVKGPNAPETLRNAPATGWH